MSRVISIEVAVQFGPVPLGEDVVKFRVGKSQGALEHPIGFADQLHVAVLDAVVDHLHVVAGAARADPLAARDVVVGTDLGRDGLEDRLHQRPGGGTSAGHHARAAQGALFAAGNARADVQKPLRFDVGRPPLGLAEVGVAAVDEHVAGREQGEKLFDEFIDRRSRLDHEHDLAGRGQAGDNFFQRVAADEVLAFAAAGQQLIHFARRAIEDRHAEAAAFDVQGQVFAHHGQADHGDVAFSRHRQLLFMLNRLWIHEGPLSLRERVRVRGTISNARLQDRTPTPISLTPALSRRERGTY